MDIEYWGVHEITMEISMVALSYYMYTRDLTSIFMRDAGLSWTTNITPMVPPSYYTKDRAPMMGNVCIRRHRGVDLVGN